MKAIRQQSFGGPEVMELVEVDRPVPDGTHVLVRVRAAGVNPVDWKIRAGYDPDTPLPYTVGWELSGIVEELGVGVTRFAPGDEVYGLVWFPKEAGAYAEYVAAPSRQFARKPASLSHEEAGSLALVGLTAWQALVDTVNLQPGQRVLVTAAAGGVGHVAVQIAKARGAYVIGTASSGKLDFVRSLGADEVIDYTTTDVSQTVKDADVVLDMVGPDNTLGLVPAMKPGGHFIPIGGGASPEAEEAATAKGVNVHLVLAEPDGHGLDQLNALVDAGKLRVEIDTAYALADAAKAHAHSETGRVRGKLVLVV